MIERKERSRRASAARSGGIGHGCGTRSRAVLLLVKWPRPSARSSARTPGSGRRTYCRASPTVPPRRRSCAFPASSSRLSSIAHRSARGAAMAYTGRRPRRHEIRDFLSVDLPARHLPPRAATSPAAHAVFDLLDTDRDGVVRRAEFFDAVGAVNRVVPPERRIDGDSVWGLLDCNGDGELERNELERGLRI